MDIRPIRTETDHKAAVREIEKLWDFPKGSPEADRLDVWATLVDAYERGHCPVSASDPIEVLRYLVGEAGHTQAELAQLLGSKSRASEILNRKRALTVEMIHRISKAWKIPASVLAVPYPLAKPAKTHKPNIPYRKSARPKKPAAKAKRAA
jgi:HTH-type transcriptional regulator/antitoxin HigA